MEVLLIFVGFLVAYLLGSIPTAVWVGKLFYHIDIREKGSGNAGATNTIRVLGVKAGIPVIIVDILKGWLAVTLMVYFIPSGYSINSLIYLKIGAGFLAVIGHVFPVFAGFRGGKGVATLLGVGIALYPNVIWIPIVTFIVILLATGYVSLGSMLGGISFPIADILMGDRNPGKVTLSIVVAIFLLYTHRKNIKRLASGTENRFYFFRKKKS